jgi:uncharacterized protein (TIGR02452 family)
MKRSTRAELANDTVEIVDRGSYRSASGRIVDIVLPVRACLAATRYYTPEQLERLRTDVLRGPAADHSAVFEVVNETTLSGIARVLTSGQGPVAALNFASARNPGGGFLRRLQTTGAGWLGVRRIPKRPSCRGQVFRLASETR